MLIVIKGSNSCKIRIVLQIRMRNSVGILYKFQIFFSMKASLFTLLVLVLTSCSEYAGLTDSLNRAEALMDFVYE